MQLKVCTCGWGGGGGVKNCIYLRLPHNYKQIIIAGVAVVVTMFICLYECDLYFCDLDVCQHGEVRLTSTLNVSKSAAEDRMHVAGRVEVCLDGTWSRVCGSNGWTSREAMVVCRQLIGPDDVMGMFVASDTFPVFICFVDVV